MASSAMPLNASSLDPKRNVGMHDGRKRQFLLGVPIVLVVATGALTLSLLSRPLRVTFHERAMLAAWNDVIRVGPGDSEQGRYIEAYEHHRDTLVRLGHFQKCTFRLEHIDVGSDEARALWLALVERADDKPIVTMEGYEPTTPPAVVVWTAPEDASEWERLVASFDKPKSGD